MRMPRYTLRSLMALVTMVAVAIAWMSSGYRRHQATGRDIRALARLGCVFDLKPPARFSIERWLPRHKVEGVSYHGELTGVRHYYGLGTETRTDEFINIVARHPELRGVVVDGTQLSDSQAARLLALPLQQLSICECPIGGTLRAEASPTLTWLSFFRTRLDDHSLAALGSLPNVETLVLYRTRVSDRSIAHLASLPRLQSINLSRCQVTADGAERLRRLRPDVKVAYRRLQ